MSTANVNPGSDTGFTRQLQKEARLRFRKLLQRHDLSSQAVDEIERAALVLARWYPEKKTMSRDRHPWIEIIHASLPIFLLLVCMFLMLFLCNPSKAATKYPIICDEIDPKKCSQPLQKGERAPFSGQLLTVPMALEQSSQARDCQEVTETAVEQAQGKGIADLDLEKTRRANDNSTSRLQLDLLQKRLEEAHIASERAWYEHPGVWFAVGAVTAILAVWAGTEIVKATGP